MIEKTEKEELFKEIHKEMYQIAGVIIEHFDDKMAILAEQYGWLTEKIDTHTEMVGIVVEDVHMLKEDIAVLKGDVAVLKEDVGSIKDTLQEKANKKDFVVLERRVSHLEL